MVDAVLAKDPSDVDNLAFVLMMIRLGGCSSCQADSFRALRGCTQCAYQTIRRYRGVDQDLIQLFDEARKDIMRYMGN